MKKRTMLLIGAAALVVIAVATGEEEEAPKEVAQEVVAEEETSKGEVKKEEASTTETEEEAVEEESSEVEEVPTDALGIVQMRPMMNGTETEKIGEYAYIASSKEAVSEKNLLSFFKNEASKYEEANYLIIDLQDGTAFHVLSGMPMLTYGAYGEEEETLVEQWETIIVDTENGTVSGTLHEGVSADKALFAE